MPFWKNLSSIFEIFQCSVDTVVAAEFHPLDRGSIVTCGKAHIAFWSLDNTGALYKRIGVFNNRDKPKYVTCVAFTQTGDVLSGDSNGSIIVWGRDSASRWWCADDCGRPRHPTARWFYEKLHPRRILRARIQSSAHGQTNVMAPVEREGKSANQLPNPPLSTTATARQRSLDRIIAVPLTNPSKKTIDRQIPAILVDLVVGEVVDVAEAESGALALRTVGRRRQIVHRIIDGRFAGVIELTGRRRH
ncbi:unnamed protein product [Nesidiocoris tenuis]|uniref:EML-like first beta-propeller domain-containing protein n=1 Tax=Nesidiocoris tenuis TaxID=355587 RepID=A0A6H5GHU9_9HEMI|nr:unnamed protein product [Nesidiocoris tenuis]